MLEKVAGLLNTAEAVMFPHCKGNRLLPIISYAFLLLFLPLTLGLYWMLCQSPRQKLWALALFSYLFYALGGLQLTGLLFALSWGTFGLARWGKSGWGIVINLLALAVFKYWGFGAENLNALATSLNLPALVPALNLALPLGISFYVFKHVGYLLDIRQKRYPPATDFLRFTTFSAFFPQISAGPISNYEDTSAQFAALPRHPQAEQLTRGAYSISIGLAKKLLIADTLGTALASGLYPLPDGGGALWAWVSVVMYAFQLYFDFSGYTDLARGVADCFGVRLPPNFNNPYLATNPAQFWQRWHISASTWFRLYLFTPISRNLLRRWGVQKREAAQYSANMVTMLLIGLWHGAGWGFVLWGGYHALLLNLSAWANYRKIRIGHPLLAGAALFVAVLFGWALFLSPDLAFAATLLSRMVGLEGLGDWAMIASLYEVQVFFTLCAAVVLTVMGAVEADNIPTQRGFLPAVILGILAVISLFHIGTAANFIYVQF